MGLIFILFSFFFVYFREDYLLEFLDFDNSSAF